MQEISKTRNFPFLSVLLFWGNSTCKDKVLLAEKRVSRIMGQVNSRTFYSRY